MEQICPAGWVKDDIYVSIIPIPVTCGRLIMVRKNFCCVTLTLGEITLNQGHDTIVWNIQIQHDSKKLWPRHGFRLWLCTVTLTMEIWPWVNILTQPWVIDNNVLRTKIVREDWWRPSACLSVVHIRLTSIIVFKLWNLLKICNPANDRNKDLNRILWCQLKI